MTPSTTVAAAPTVSFTDLGLPAVLVQALRRDGIEAPFPIQAATVPDALAGKDVLGRGPTGSGKTLAFGLPMLARLAGAASQPGRPRGLVLVPTRELAAQIERALDAPALALGLRVASVVGGAPIKRQADRLARGVDLLIATPGRLADLVMQRSASLADVRITALDEADHMADMGFLPQVTKLLDQTPKDGQRLLFSATLDGEVDKLVKRYLRSPVTHSTAPPAASVATMTHHLLFVRDKLAKRAVASEIAAREGLTIMFVRTKHGADRLAKQLRGVGIPAGALHGGKAQNNRTRTLAAFADGSVPVLVTTDVAARGIHVDGISLVVHVDPPAESKAYLHRAGRTARAGEDGVVVTLVMDEERRDVESMTRKAGVDIKGIAVRPGDRTLIEITGARQPSGVPVAAPAPPKQAAAEGGSTTGRRRSGATGRRSGAADPAGRPARAGRSGAGSGRGTGGRSAGAAKGFRDDATSGGTNNSRNEGSGKGFTRRDDGTTRANAGATGRGAAARGGSTGRGAASAKIGAGRGAAPASAGRTTAGAAGFAGTGARSGGNSTGDTPGRARRRAVRPERAPSTRNHGAN
ncbi:DEAD/DEAH box helicase [Nocardia brasiliensis]|uniref:RNA helicase n=1 Tax=Nocardia brasiliensis (strain ATCC 700358 / HUJEG-1) TaxID=1133849 RepID=K0EYE2_NOCB7|nr:DEAD/DEAH box helicase [Nocardia brasiliensis]AFU01875.1 RNA helicase [Nocardia brasiliensis ATCC 700358]OCF89340.1 DEAD/DEAH box helicase [Nocardia brasiliensis]